MPTAIELAEQFQVSLVGEGSLALQGLAPLERALASQVSFLSNPLYRQQASDSAAGGLILSQADLDFLQANPSAHSAQRVYFVSKNPYASLPEWRNILQRYLSLFMLLVFILAPSLILRQYSYLMSHRTICTHRRRREIRRACCVIGQYFYRKKSSIDSDTLIYPAFLFTILDDDWKALHYS
jgi:UDP-3-O-[3-hydroxymyristoyl] glucosamine N-acyltransferase